nr:hypothetical protein CFP56_68666 [Quercus suber]
MELDVVMENAAIDAGNAKETVQISASPRRYDGKVSCNMRKNQAGALCSWAVHSGTIGSIEWRSDPCNIQRSNASRRLPIREAEGVLAAVYLAIPHVSILYIRRLDEMICIVQCSSYP